MPGVTPLGLRYPLPWETVTAQSFQDLSEDIDGVLDNLDVLRTSARVPQMASVFMPASTSVPQGVTTALTFTSELVDTANIVNLGVNNDRMTLGAGLWFCTGHAFLSGATTNTGTQLHFNLNSALVAFHRIDDTSFVTHGIMVQALIYVPTPGSILQLMGTWFGTGGPASWSGRMDAWRVRGL